MDATPDQSETGTTRDGWTWAVARYGPTLYVTTTDGPDEETDDTVWSSEAEAEAEFNHTVQLFLNYPDGGQAADQEN